MGHKVSVIHGVKSNDYYRPGNAINEIWLGHLELISRLPFGDSDLGQAGWPAGGWPKIPWHNFIIPLKKRAEETVNKTVHHLHKRAPVDGQSIAPKSPDWFRLNPLWAYCYLGGFFLFACAVPIVLKHTTLPYRPARIRWDDGFEQQRMKAYERRAYAALVFLCMATLLCWLSFVSLVLVKEQNILNNFLFEWLLMVVTVIVSVFCLCYAALAALFLWLNFRAIDRQEDVLQHEGIDLEVCATTALVDQDFRRHMERQRRA